MARTEKPKVDFFSYYAELYGPRWPSLLESLKNPKPMVARYNYFASVAKPSHGPMDIATIEAAAGHARAHHLQESAWDANLRGYKLLHDQSVVLQKTEQDVFAFYVMDAASIVAARNLNLSPGQRVLDMCAAPGGKSLILAEQLFRDLDSQRNALESQSMGSELILNELSADRRERLQKVLKSYIPYDQRQNIWTKGQDASLFGVKQPESFDRVLLDAPCSSEAHVLESEAALKEWSPKRSKGLAQRQFSMISSAFLALKSGGEALYSTCSIHPQENDEVIERLLERRKDSVELISEIDGLGLEYQKTQFGFEFFPDQSSCGPFFLARFRKR